MSVTYDQMLAAEASRRDATDYRFNYWTYLGWTIVTVGLYSHYATYKVVQRRHEHAQRRIAFQAYFWHVLSGRAEAAGRRDQVAEGMDNLARAHAQMESFERANRREPALWTILRFVLGLVGAYINHFLNRDLRFYDEWESAWAANAVWVLGRLGSPVTVPQRRQPVPDRPTGLYVVLSIVTLGIFAAYWRYAVMVDGNSHFDDDASIEDALLAGLGVASPAPGGPPPVPPVPPVPPLPR